MLARLTRATVALLLLTGPSFAWTDIYIERAAMAEAGREVCGIRNRSLAARYRDRAAFFTRWSPEAIQGRIDERKAVVVGRLVDASAVRTFCARIRGGDF